MVTKKAGLPSHYRLTRTRIVDSAGTSAEESLLTTQRERLSTALRDSFESSGYPQDSCHIAWVATIEDRENKLADFYPPTLTIFSAGKKQSFALLPDMTVRRGAARLALRLVRTGAKVEKVEVLDLDGHVTATFASLEELGADDALLEPLRTAPGELVTEFDFAGLVASIPELSGDVATGPLPFRPFFKFEEFADFLADEVDEELLELLPGGSEWDGYIPLDRWFPADELLRAFEDCGYAENPSW